MRIIAATHRTPSPRLWLVVLGNKALFVAFHETAYVIWIDKDVIIKILIEQICKLADSVPKNGFTLLQSHFPHIIFMVTIRLTAAHLGEAINVLLCQSFWNSWNRGSIKSFGFWKLSLFKTTLFEDAKNYYSWYHFLNVAIKRHHMYR